MTKQKKKENVLDKIPIRQYEWDENGNVTIKVPRFRSNIGQKFCKVIKKGATYNVHLDKHGSLAWRLCDGKRTVGDIGRSLALEFGEEVEPVFLRVSELFNILEANKLITYKKPNNHLPPEGEESNGTD